MTHCIRLQASLEVRTPEENESIAEEEAAHETSNGITRPDNAHRERKIWKGGRLVPRNSVDPSVERPALLNSFMPTKPQNTPTGARNTPSEAIPHDKGNERSARASTQPSSLNKTGNVHLCTCGNSAKNARKAIACADPVGLHARPDITQKLMFDSNASEKIII